MSEQCARPGTAVPGVGSVTLHDARGSSLTGIAGHCRHNVSLQWLGQAGSGFPRLRSAKVSVRQPSASIDINRTWCVAATIACNLLCWLWLLRLDGPMATAEPKTLRYRLLHTPLTRRDSRTNSLNRTSTTRSTTP